LVEQYPYFNITPSYVQVGVSMMKRREQNLSSSFVTTFNGCESPLVLQNLLNPLENLIKVIKF
jgi:hypothetical protein